MNDYSRDSESLPNCWTGARARIPPRPGAGYPTRGSLYSGRSRIYPRAGARSLRSVLSFTLQQTRVGKGGEGEARPLSTEWDVGGRRLQSMALDGRSASCDILIFLTSNGSEES